MRERIIQIVLPAVLLLSLAMPTTSRAADSGATESGAAHPVPPTPLAQLLNADNTLNLGSGFSGSLDARGWTMHTDSNGSPRFVPAAQSGPTSVLDDAAWDSRFGSPGVNGTVLAVAVSGTDVYVGGSFTQAGNLWASSIARWDGQSWSALGGGIPVVVDTLGVRGLAVSGNEVYAGGIFDDAANQSTNNILRWDGSAWQPFGGGNGTRPIGLINAIAVAGQAIYTGSAPTIGLQETATILRWSQDAWRVLGGSVENGVNGTIATVAISGTEVYVGGLFTRVGSASRQ